LRRILERRLIYRNGCVRTLSLATTTLLFLLASAASAEAAFGFRKEIRIVAAQVPGTSNLPNFPVLVSFVDPNLRSVPNGGRVQNVNGYDIVFRNGGCAFTTLDHEIESYDPVTGTLRAWVRIPTLSATTDTFFEVYYGNPTIVSSQENVNAVWDSNFKGVWHLKENPAGGAPQMRDSTIENNHATSIGAMTLTDQVPAKINGGLDFDGVDDLIHAGDQPELQLPIYSWSMWLKGDSAPITGLPQNQQPIWNANRQFNFSWGHGVAAFTKAAAHEDSTGWKASKIVTNLIANTWYYIAATYDGANLRVYLNGALENTQAAGAPLVSAGVFSIGGSFVGNDPFPGDLDEVRVSNVARSPEWIATAYNNESSPSTFYTVGPELSGADCVTNYRSIGTNPGVLYATGTASVAMGSSVVTFSGAVLPVNVGVGDRLTMGAEVFHILSRDSATQVTVQSPATLAHVSEAYTIVRAYNSLQAWESARQGNLVFDNRNEVGVAYHDGVFNLGVDIDGSTTDPNRFMKLTVARPHRHRGVSGTGSRVHGLNAVTGEILIEDDFTVLEWMEVRGTRGSPTAAGVRIRDAKNVLLSHLLIHDNVAGIRLSGGGNNSFAVRNSIVYKNDTLGIQGDEATDAVAVENCTLYANGGNGIDGLTFTAFAVTNTISMGHPSADFAIPVATGSNNISSDASATGTGPLPNRTATANPSPGLGNWVVFRSLTPSVEDFHLLSSPENDAIDAAADLSSKFQRDIDDGLRQTLWDVGADDVLASGRVAFSSANHQGFLVGAGTTLAATMTVTDDLFPTITAANDIRVRIPAGFPMAWDPAFNLPIITGSGAGKVLNQVKAFEDSGRTLVLDVTSDFAPSDQIQIGGVRFFNFTNPSPIQFLELEVGNDDVVSAFDNKTIQVTPGVNPRLSSATSQVFTVGAPDTPAATFFVTDALAAVINATNDFVVRIPAAFNMEWDTSIVNVSVGGSAASKVSTTVSYADSRTLVINVTTNFGSGDFVSVSGLEFRTFSNPSPAANLELVVNSSTYFDDKTIEVSALSDVPFFSATATGIPSEVVLEWVTPFAGSCTQIVIFARDGGTPPTSPSDPLARPLGGSFPCAPQGSRQSVTDPVAIDGALTGYGAFVDTGSGFTGGRKLVARSFDESTTNVRWAYSTGATSMAPPGLRFGGGKSYIYAVSNDSKLHAMQGGRAATSGQWPVGWTPFALGAPAQNRPPVLSIPIGPATSGAALLGSQDGQVYAVNVIDGSLGWKTSVASMVQAAPAGHFSAFLGTAHDRILVGTRNASVENELVALDLDGNVRWRFTNASGPQLGDDKDLGIIAGSVSIDYLNDRVYFATRKDTGSNPSPDTLWCLSFTGTTVQKVWSADVGNVDGSPILHQGVVYVGNNAGTVYAVDALGGGTNWSYALGDGPIKGFPFPQFGTTNLLLSTNTHVWSLADNITFASENWNVDATVIPSPSTPLYVPGTTNVFVGSSNGKLYQIDVNTPLPVKSITLGSGAEAVGAPTFDLLELMIYVGTDAGVIYGIHYPLP
jgi:outer membrane protein assembly factor BamB